MQNTTARVLLSASKHLRLNNIHHFNNRSQTTLAGKQDLPHLHKLFCPRRPKISSCTSPVLHQQVRICTSSVRSSLRTQAQSNSSNKQTNSEQNDKLGSVGSSLRYDTYPCVTQTHMGFRKLHSFHNPRITTTA